MSASYLARSRKAAIKRTILWVSVSPLALAIVAPAHAQTALVRTLRNSAVQIATQTVTGSTSTPVMSPTMQQALANQANNQARIAAMQQIVADARNAAVAATRITPVNGISAAGLQPIDGVRQLVITGIIATDSAATAQAAPAGSIVVWTGTAASAPTVSGVTVYTSFAQVPGNVVSSNLAAANDASGVATWDGATAPVQGSDASGNVTVSINQTQARALLSWTNFDIGAQTTLQFNQRLNGVAQTGWTAVNRVVNGIAPSTILGAIKADGTVVVLNSQGVIFGQNSQVNTQSLLVSTLELGAGYTTASNGTLYASTVQQRNENYLQNGLFAAATQSVALLSPNYYAAGVTQVTDTSYQQVPLEGSIVLDAGARVTAGTGGYVIMAAPKIDTSATINAVQGQVSLEGGRQIYATESTGGSGSIDPGVRGYLLRSWLSGRDDPSTPPSSAIADDGVVTNEGLIQSQDGYISLGTGMLGSVTNSGLLLATTSVSRNGKIALYGGTVTLSGNATANDASGIAILPDENGETLPQGSAAADFISSQIVIGTYGRATANDSLFSSTHDLVGTLTPDVFTMGQNALIYAPNASVVVGRASTAVDPLTSLLNSSIDILDGATIDVSGLKDVQLAMSTNSVEISPVTQNDLNDTPNYRSTSTSGAFTLNGTTLYIDQRVTGVRSDGTVWVGSPLLDVGSAVAQVPDKIDQLMTKGGSVTLSVNGLTGPTSAARAPHVNIAGTASIDISGGWETFLAGSVEVSNLITADGRLVAISAADPNGDYIGVANGYTATSPTFGVSNTYSTTLSQGSTYEASYFQGSDAGTLVVTSPAINFAGTIEGQAFAGALQSATGTAASTKTAFGSSYRYTQTTPYELPSGAAIQIGSFSGGSQAGLGADIVVYDGTRNASTSYSQTLLSAEMLSNAGLSALSLQTSGQVIFTSGSETLLDPSAVTLNGASNLTLAPRGVLDVEAGRSISFGGTITAPDGSVSATTMQLATPALTNALTNTNANFAAIGSPFTTADDIATSYTSQAAVTQPYDITVTGTISTAGLFTNDLLVTDGLYQGPAYLNGGSISLTVAPNVIAAISPDGGKTTTGYADLSGRLTIASSALLDVSAGAYVSTTGAVTTTGKGGNISLIDETTYAPLLSFYSANGNAQTTAYDLPAVMRSGVFYNESSLKAFGFVGKGGGTFTLYAPSIGFGSDPVADGANISLNFFTNTGFGALNVTTLATKVEQNLFSGDSASYGLLATTDFTIHAGETFNLSQSMLPTQLSPLQLTELRALASGSTLTSVLTPTVPSDAWDQLAANLTLAGLTELDVEAGGTLTGAAQASVTLPKLYNAGTIILAGGTITQQQSLPGLLADSGIGIDASLDNLSSVFGPADANGAYDGNSANLLGLTYTDQNYSVQATYTNRQLVKLGSLYLLGTLGQNEGVRLTAGSVTDLSGTVIYNPYAGIKSDGTQIVTGKMIDGGSIYALPSQSTTKLYFDVPTYAYDPRNQAGDPTTEFFWQSNVQGQAFNALPGATVSIAGASASFDIAESASSYAASAQWSNGGTISALGGGTIAGATIKAAGGSSQATGGTLEWLNPTLTQTVAGNSANMLLASQVEASGFDTFIARGTLTLNGPSLSLSLNDAFLVESAPRLDPTATVATNAEDVVITATAGTNAVINAPYISFSSTRGTVATADAGFVSANTAASGTATVTFNAGALGIDVVGALVFSKAIGQTTLTSVGDLRLTGVNDGSAPNLSLLNGELLTDGNLTIDAARTYATTGTGNLQQILENLSTGTVLSMAAEPFDIAAYGNSTITFLGTHINDTTPLSAGSYLRVQAENIVQDGYLAAPLGVLELGGNGNASILGNTKFSTSQGGKNPRAILTDTLTFGTGSVTTVSAADVTVGGQSSSIPYGTTVDLTSYYFAPTESNALTVAPSGEFILTGKAVTVASGATLNGNGGGDTYGYEWVAGTGGSHDVLSRYNTDPYTSNSYNATLGYGYQYADKRQVYAIVPADQADKLAFYDPNYSAGYSNLYGAGAGTTVHLDGGDGIPAGNYVLLPAQYATLPGAYRLVENTGATAPYVGSATQLLDGSVIMGGTFGNSVTGKSGSTRYSFTIESQSTFKKYSTIDTTSLTTQMKTQASASGVANPSLALDAARVVLDALDSLTINGTFNLTAATGGQGTKIDIAGSDIVIGASDPGTSGALFLSNATLANLDANSLFIGGLRQNNVDGTTTLNVTASTITVDSDAVLSAPEILLAVGARDGTTVPQLTIDKGASITATGTLTDTRTGNYIIPASANASATDAYAQTGVGAALLVSSGPQRLFERQIDTALPGGGQEARLKINSATLSGTDIALDSSRSFAISNSATFKATNIAVSGNSITIGAGDIGPAIIAKLEAASSLTLRSSGLINFANGTYTFNNLTLDTPGIAKLAASKKLQQAAAAVTINATSLDWYASEGSFAGCTFSGGQGCGVAGSSLAINADTITLGSGTLGVTGFNNQSTVTLTAAKGIYIGGAGSLSIGNLDSSAATASSLTMVAPFLVDTATVANPIDQTVTPSFAFNTLGAFSLIAPTSSGTTQVPTGNRAPGAKILIGSSAAPVSSATIDGAAIIATAGTIDIESAGNITLAGAAQLEVPGYSKTFGDSTDSTTVSAGAGSLILTSLHGNITLPSSVTLVTDNGVGKAGALNLLAGEGSITLAASLNPGVTGARGGSFTYDTQTSGFDLAGFVTQYGTLFEGDVAIRAGQGNLTLNAGQVLRATSVTLTADDTSLGNGTITIDGTIDTSGLSVAGLTLAKTENLVVDGGNIALYGNNGLTLGATALLDTHTTGYLDSDTRQASAGNVTLGIASDSAALTIDTGAVINVGATRLSGQTGNRLVAQKVTDASSLTPTTVYDFVQADTGGTVTFRAPVEGAAGNSTVNIVLPKTLPVKGAASIQIEGFKTYALDTLSARSDISGITSSGGTVSLNVASETGAAGAANNLLADYFVTADGLQSVPYFVENFAITAANGTAFDSAIVSRPGIVLNTSGNLTLASNWNLGAGTINFAKAVANGDAVLNNVNGWSYYSLVAGHEAQLLQNDTTMVYRVGTGVGNIANAAPVISLIAGKTLTTNYSITDGMFTFRNVTDPNYTTYALGGGNRSVLPSGRLSCQVQCSNVTSTTFTQAAEALASGALDPTTVLTLDFGHIKTGADVTSFTAPLTQQANSASFAQTSGYVAGDPMSAAEVFPLLDGGTAYAQSSSLRLVGGAGATLSANPLHVDKGSAGDVVVQGQGTYSLTAATGTDAYSNGANNTPTLDLTYGYTGTSISGSAAPLKDYYAVTSDLVDTLNSDSNLTSTSGAFTGQEYTVLKFGGLRTALGAYLQKMAAAYFHYVDPTTYNFATNTATNIGIAQGSAKQPTGVAAPLSEITAFLNSVDPTTGMTIAQTVAQGVVSGTYRAAKPTTPKVDLIGGYSTVTYGSIIRTGDGTIDVAAARDVTLTRTSNVVYNTVQNSNGIASSSGEPAYQVGGTAIYTVGHRALSTPVTASTADGAVVLALTFAQTAQDSSYYDGAYVPTALQQNLLQPDLLTGGGAVTISAGRDVVGRRDAWSQVAETQGANYFDQRTGLLSNTLAGISQLLTTNIGTDTQLWRAGTVGQDTLIGITANMFTAGVGTLGGGNIVIKAGGDVSELTVAADTSVVTANSSAAWTNKFDRFATLTARIDGTNTPSAPVMATLGGGNVSLSVGGNLYGSQIDVASGQGTITVGGDIANATTALVQVPRGNTTTLASDALNLRVADASVSVLANGSVAMTGISALGALSGNGAESESTANAQGFFTSIAGLDLVAGGTVTFAANAQSVGGFNVNPFYYSAANLITATAVVTAPTLEVTALTGDISLGHAQDISSASVGEVPYLLYASPVGELSLLSGGSIQGLSVAMLDSDPSLLPGAFTTYQSSGGSIPTANNLGFTYPGASPSAPQQLLRLLHSTGGLHTGDTAPVRIYANGTLRDATINVDKQARIGVGQDIVNLYFVGQNLASDDTTRIVAGRDITGTVATDVNHANASGGYKQYVVGNSFVLGGPGTFDVEAGRNLGPFVSSGVVDGVAYAGGIRSVGNELNPWLGTTGADIQVLFGVSNGIDYSAFRETYLDPANFTNLDSALFVQTVDSAGVSHPDRSQPIYAPVLAQWMETNAPAAFASVFGNQTFTTAQLTAASYANYAKLYAAFLTLSQLDQDKFMIQKVYFSELASVSNVNSPSYKQYVRGYRAVQTLFPATWGYTDNLATYTTDASTVTADHPLGVPTRNVVNGQPQVATEVHTGNADLRLATIETDEGGNIDILGPGGSFIAGSVVRTSQQISLKTTSAPTYTTGASPVEQVSATTGYTTDFSNASNITSVPLGYEGLITLRGGDISTFTDANFLLNQSRVFTLGGGDIVMWSSNGDLNAGQGAKTSSDYPPVTVQFSLDGQETVDSAGSVSGAGIGTFQSSPSDPASSVTLVAPAGTVDAGDAGVRASGNVVVAAARVANADNFKAGGSVSGVPSASAVAAPATPASAASSVIASVAKIADSNRADSDKTIITVEVTGSDCSNDDDDPNKRCS